MKKVALLLIMLLIVTGCDKKVDGEYGNVSSKVTTSEITSQKKEVVTSTQSTLEQSTTTTTFITTKENTSTTKKTSTNSTTKSTVKSTDKTTKTTKKTTTNSSSKFICTPLKSLPSGAVWYKTWGNTGIDYGEYMEWAKKVDEMKILMDAASKIPALEGTYGGRTTGGLTPIWCKEDTIGTIYGVYFEINGYQVTRDDTGKQVEKQASKGYMKSDGSIKWVYKNY